MRQNLLENEFFLGNFMSFWRKKIVYENCFLGKKILKISPMGFEKSILGK